MKMEVRSIEDLKLQNISTATLVWYNGMDEWKYASEIDELKPFFAILRLSNKLKIQRK
jgi:hypothetical protein